MKHAPEAPLPPVPSTSLGRYEVLHALGAGGMATVYLGRCADAGLRVAIKRLHDFVAEDPTNIALLRDEARLAASIRHPNVVGILDVIEGGEATAPAIVMEWIEGVNLATLSAAAARLGRRIPTDVAVAIVRDVLAGLHAAHEATRDDGLALEIVHRDVSPQNILVGVDGVARVTDFGVAKAAWRSQVTEIGAIKGKLGYMAPEQLEGRGDRRIDLYGAGVVLWELLTGQRLRSSEGTGAQMLVQILHGVVSAPSSVQADAADLDGVVLRALARDPEGRFATTREMAEELVACVTPASPERVAAIVAELAYGKAPVAVAAAPTQREVAPARPSIEPARTRVHRSPAARRAELRFAAQLSFSGRLWGAAVAGSARAAGSGGSLRLPKPTPRARATTAGLDARP